MILSYSMAALPRKVFPEHSTMTIATWHCVVLHLLHKISPLYETSQRKQYHLDLHVFIGTILSLSKQTLAVLLGPNNFSFTYEPGVGDSNVFPGTQTFDYMHGKCIIKFCFVHLGGVPLDGKPIRTTHTYKLWLVITYNTFVTFGLVFAVSCFMFNLIFRNTV